MSDSKDTIRRLIKIFLYLFPLLVILFMGYTAYLEITKSRVSDTIKDIKFFTKNLPICHKPLYYKEFDSDFVSYYTSCLPGSLKIVRTTHGNEIMNRFGGKMIFKESPKTVDERRTYLYLTRERKMYETHYQGLSAYTILFTELKTQECANLAITDWEKVSPNFMGFEASFLSPKHPYNGIDHLNYHVLEDNANEVYKGNDMGVVSRKPLKMINALKACSCLKDNCTFALKFK